ncbi:hypothetical protein [Devosia alba]|uniref:hypothetical protein n=1 Tax=Devosia alba TaxID=3152360 RepID=UPI00326643A1
MGKYTANDLDPGAYKPGSLREPTHPRSNPVSVGDDLVERLRDYGGFTDPTDHENDCTEAARRLEELEAQLKAAREALEPFAEYMKDGGDLDNKGNPLPDSDGVGWVYLTQGDFRRARAAMPKPPEVDGQKPS